MTLYDVCNDDSLDPAEDQTLPDPKVYKEYKEESGGVLYYHRQYDELHYFYGEDGLKGTLI